MSKTAKTILWGILLILVGVIIALNIMGVKIPIFFDGWWTLLIILPCLYGIVVGADRFLNAIGLLIGVGLLLAARDVIQYRQLARLVLPVCLILIGGYLIVRAVFRNPSGNVPSPSAGSNASYTQTASTGNKEYNAFLSGSKLNFDGQSFHGAKFSAILGSVSCDLRNAFITQDITIEANTFFGSVELFMPADVHVVVENSSFLGDLKNRAVSPANVSAPTVTVKVTNFLGSTEIQ